MNKFVDKLKLDLNKFLQSASFTGWVTPIYSVR